MPRRQTFSQRFNIEPITVDVQRLGMDDALRNSLWNVLHSEFFSKREVFYAIGTRKPLAVQVATLVFRDHLKLPVDAAPEYSEPTVKFFKMYMAQQPWNKVYDLLEFIVSLNAEACSRLADYFNFVLERENSAYRFVDGLLTEVVDEQSIDSIEEAVNNTPYESVSMHMRQALALYSDRESPDYRNSVKESISAVESMAQIITGNAKASLGEALKKVQETHPLHEALKKGFAAIYGYTSDEGGIRHALSGNESVSSAEAQFMLVACSAFINYLKAISP